MAQLPQLFGRQHRRISQGLRQSTMDPRKTIQQKGRHCNQSHPATGDAFDDFGNFPPAISVIPTILNGKDIRWR